MNASGWSHAERSNNNTSGQISLPTGRPRFRSRCAVEGWYIWFPVGRVCRSHLSSGPLLVSSKCSTSCLRTSQLCYEPSRHGGKRCILRRCSPAPPKASYNLGTVPTLFLMSSQFGGTAQGDFGIVLFPTPLPSSLLPPHIESAYRSHVRQKPQMTNCKINNLCRCCSGRPWAYQQHHKYLFAWHLLNQ